MRVKIYVRNDFFWSIVYRDERWEKEDEIYKLNSYGC